MLTPAINVGESPIGTVTADLDGEVEISSTVKLGSEIRYTPYKAGNIFKIRGQSFLAIRIARNLSGIFIHRFAQYSGEDTKYNSIFGIHYSF